MLKTRCEKTGYIIICLVCLCAFLAGALLSLDTVSDNISEYKTSEIASIQNLYNVSIMNKLKVTEMFARGILDQNTIELVKQAGSGDESQKQVAREKLYQAHITHFEYLKQIGIRELQFHLPNTESLLRFQSPDKFGDRLINIRDSINQVIKTHASVHAFEEGRFHNGYRYLFPIMEDETYLGSVEFSYSMKSIVMPIENTYELESVLIVDKDVVDTTTAARIEDLYLPDTTFELGYIDKDFYHFDLSRILCTSESTLDALHNEFDKDVFDNKDSISNMHVYSCSNATIWILAMPIKNNTGKQVAVLLLYKNDPVLQNMLIQEKQTLYGLVFIGIIVITLLSFTYYLLYKMQKQANFDALTQLYNRNFYTKHLSVRFNNSSGVILMIDIDDFKFVNDTYGHSFGDTVLKAVGTIIRQNTRGDDFAFRWGGEEFLLYLKDVHKSIGLNKAKHLCKVIESHDFDGVKLTVSIGVCPLDSSLEDTIRFADDALYQAKHSGKNTAVMYHPDHSSPN